MFTGDTLFAGGCGRLFEGDAAMMIKSLSKLSVPPDDTRVYFGHEYTEKNLRFALTLEDAPLPAFKGFSATLSPLRRPSPETAPTEAKVSGLYVHVGRISAEAEARGFNTAVVLDLNGNVAEFAAANLFIVKDGTVHTPVANRTFLNGITRQRVIRLLRAAQVEVVERTLTFAEVMEADEIFSRLMGDVVEPRREFIQANALQVANLDV